MTDTVYSRVICRSTGSGLMACPPLGNTCWWCWPTWMTSWSEPLTTQSYAPPASQGSAWRSPCPTTLARNELWKWSSAAARLGIRACPVRFDQFCRAIVIVLDWITVSQRGFRFMRICGGFMWFWPSVWCILGLRCRLHPHRWRTLPRPLWAVWM